jgi:splicing factor U2AF subunit
MYVGNIPPCTDQELQAFFSATISRVYMPGTHCLSAQVSSADRKFAFLEFSTVDMATAALQLDGVTFKGSQLKVRRPNDYNAAGQPPPSGPPIQFNVSNLGLVSSTVPDGPNKVFVGGLPHTLQEEQLKELLQSFGQLKGLHMVRDSGAANNKGYAFCEYADPSITDTAIAALHNLPLADKQLTVRRATSRSGGEAVPQIAMGMGMGLGLGVPGMPGPMGFGATPGVQLGLGVPSHMPTRPPTRLLRLQGMVGGADLSLPPTDWRDLVEDITSGLKDHGSIQALHVSRAGPHAGNVYVMYADPGCAQAAVRAVAGKTFDGRLIPVEYEEEGRLQEIQSQG